MLLSPTSSDATLPSASGFWSKLKKGGGKDNDKSSQQVQQAQMALSRQRLVTLVHGDMETVRMLPNTFHDLEMVARDWVKPPEGMAFSLRIPTEYASFQAARYIAGPYIWITSEEAYQIAIMGVQGSRVEILCDAPPPPDEPPPPPPPPVLEMDGMFALELEKGKNVAIDVRVSSLYEDMDLARMEDGTMVNGMFWGKLDIVHDGDTHKMEFSGTRLQDQNYSPDFMFDSRVMSKLTVAAKPATAKCTLSILSPTQQYAEVFVSFSPMWKIGMTWPPAENQTDDKFKYFLRVHPGGALEHFESESVVTSIYYEAMPDSGMIDPPTLVSPYNSFAMSFREFVPHISKVLEQLGLTIQARSNFINNNMSAFSAHKNIAYRIMSPSRLARAIDISVTADPCVWTRIFVMFRGVSEDEMVDFVSAGEKEAMNFDWRAHVGWTEASKDQDMFRVLEVSILECT